MVRLPAPSCLKVHGTNTSSPLFSSVFILPFPIPSRRMAVIRIGSTGEDVALISRNCDCRLRGYVSARIAGNWGLSGYLSAYRVCRSIGVHSEKCQVLSDVVNVPPEPSGHETVAVVITPSESRVALVSV